MNRRTFLKSIAAACGAAVVCPGELSSMITRTDDQSVVWGIACSDYRKGWNLYAKGTPDWLPWGIFGTVVCVKVIEPIKAGQSLVWNPDGTVRGA